MVYMNFQKYFALSYEYPRAERMEAVGGIAGLPAEEEAFAMFSLGYPAGEIKEHHRFREEWIRWIE